MVTACNELGYILSRMCLRTYLWRSAFFSHSSLRKVSRKPKILNRCGVTVVFIYARLHRKCWAWNKTFALKLFHAGRRICVGEPLARMELFLYLSTMMQLFRFLPPEDGTLPSLRGILGLTYEPKPFKMRFCVRANRMWMRNCRYIIRLFTPEMIYKQK